MARIHALGGTIIMCDADEACIERFVTGSDRSVHDDQLRFAGWQVQGGAKSKHKRDLCPWHRDKPMTMEERYGKPPAG